MLSEALERDALMQKLLDGNEVSYTYQLEVNGKPVYYCMRALHETDGGEDWQIIGERNIDTYFPWRILRNLRFQQSEKAQYLWGISLHDAGKKH